MLVNYNENYITVFAMNFLSPSTMFLLTELQDQ